MSDDNTVKLSKPLKTHAGEVSTLTLQEPTARSFIEHGEPFKMKVTRDDKDEVSVDFTYDNRIMSKFLSDMSGIDDILLGSLRATDFYALRTKATHIIVGLTGQSPI